MSITDFLNHLALERMTREFQARIVGTAPTYSCGDAEILSAAIEVAHA